MMQRKPRLLALLLIGTAVLSSCQRSKENRKELADASVDTAWAILPFHKADSANPILTAGDGEFTCPVLGKTVKWEEKDVFNPAAVVKDGKVYLLYRAEDKSENIPVLHGLGSR